MVTTFDPPPARPIAELLAQDDAKSLRMLALALQSAIDSPFFDAKSGARFPMRRVVLDGSTPTFPGAVVVADGLGTIEARSSAAVVELHRAELLATPVVRAAGRDHTVAEVLAAVADSASESAIPAPAQRACMRAIARVVLQALGPVAPLAREIEPIITRHTVPGGASLFVARDSALNTLGIDSSLDGGFTWAAAVRFVRPRASQSCVVYEVGDVQGDSLIFSVRAAADESTHFLCRLPGGTVLEVGAPVPGLFDRYVRLVAIARFAPYSQLRVWADDLLIGRARSDRSSSCRLVGRQTIGAGILGKHRSALFMRELMLIGRPLDARGRSVITRHLERHL